MRTATPRTLITAAACSALFLTASGCGNDPEPTPTTSTSPSPSKSAWESKFTEKQKAEYEAALSRFTEYEQRAEPIWADGKVTPAAKALFAEYWAVPLIPQTKLTFNEQVGDKVNGIAKVTWSHPSKVTIRAAATNVSIEQCIDPSSIKVEHAPDAKVQEKHQGPYIRTISLDKVGSKPYLIREVIDVTSGKKMTPCEP